MIKNLIRARILRLLNNITFSTYSKNTQGQTLCVKYCDRLLNRNQYISRLFYMAGFFGFFQTAHASSPQKVDLQSQLEKEIKNATVPQLLKKSDDLFSVGKYKESNFVLEELKNLKNVEVLWRLARGLYNMSKLKDVKAPEKAEMIEEAYDYLQTAMELDTNHFAVHKWMAILVDARSSLEGIKARISNLPTFRKHLMIAMELNPKDATSIYMLGQYCYNIAEMSWVQRKIASALFATPPVATYEEALTYFSKAEEVEPNFYSLNLLMLGKTYLQLKSMDAARYWLKCACNYPVRTDEDEMVRKEAEELLKKYPLKKTAKTAEEDQKNKTAGDS